MGDRDTVGIRCGQLPSDIRAVSPQPKTVIGVMGIKRDGYHYVMLADIVQYIISGPPVTLNEGRLIDVDGME